MSVWPEVRAELLRLREMGRHVLMSYPNPHADPEPAPPYDISLTADAQPVAEQLHRRFGDQVRLRVGALPFPLEPDESIYRPVPHDPVPPGHQLDGIQVELDGPLNVESGATANHAVLIGNDTDREVALKTNGQLTAHVVDLSDGRHVGGFAGAQTMPLVLFSIPPGDTVRVPLLVATASFDPALGYSIPPGRWGVTADLQLADGRELRMPVLPIEVMSAM